MPIACRYLPTDLIFSVLSLGLILILLTCRETLTKGTPLSANTTTDAFATEPKPTSSPINPVSESPSDVAIAHCEAAVQALEAGDTKKWQHHVKEAYLIYDTQHLPVLHSRLILKIALAHAKATPGEENSVTAIQSALNNINSSPEKRTSFRELHFAEEQYPKINLHYTAVE